MTKTLNKYERQEQLRDFGLYVPVQHTIDDRMTKAEFIKLTTNNKFSIRSISNKADYNLAERNTIMNELEKSLGIHKDNLDKGFPPHVFSIPALAAWPVVKALLAYEITPVVTDGIHPKDALYAGCMQISDKKIIIEVVAGEGSMVRQVSREGKIDISYNVDNPSKIDDRLLRLAVLEALSVPKDNIIYEFSIYNFDRPQVVWWDFHEQNKYYEG